MGEGDNCCCPRLELREWLGHEWRTRDVPFQDLKSHLSDAAAGAWSPFTEPASKLCIVKVKIKEVKDCRSESPCRQALADSFGMPEVWWTPQHLNSPGYFGCDYVPVRGVEGFNTWVFFEIKKVVEDAAAPANKPTRPGSKANQSATPDDDEASGPGKSRPIEYFWQKIAVFTRSFPESGRTVVLCFDHQEDKPEPEPELRDDAEGDQPALRAPPRRAVAVASPEVCGELRGSGRSSMTSAAQGELQKQQQQQQQRRRRRQTVKRQETELSHVLRYTLSDPPLSATSSGLAAPCPALDDPFWIYTRIAADVARLEEDSVWAIRDYVRAIEKQDEEGGGGGEAGRSRDGADGGDEDGYDGEYDDDYDDDRRPAVDYRRLHDIQRHATHVTETLDIAVQTLEAVRRAHGELELFAADDDDDDGDDAGGDGFDSGGCYGSGELCRAAGSLGDDHHPTAASTAIPTPRDQKQQQQQQQRQQRRQQRRRRWTRTRWSIRRSLEASSRLVASVRHRSASNEKRLQNEIQLAYNLAAQHDAGNSVQIAKATKEDSVAMRTISLVTLVFLPPTFLSTVFGMGFFDLGGESGRELVVGDWFWLYWVLAAVLMAATGLLYYLFGPGVGRVVKGGGGGGRRRRRSNAKLKGWMKMETRGGRRRQKTFKGGVGHEIGEEKRGAVVMERYEAKGNDDVEKALGGSRREPAKGI